MDYQLPTIDYRLPTTDGYALIIAVFAMVLISALVTAGFFLSSQQFRSGKANLRANAGLYSAEAGLSSALAAWEPAVAERLAPGATIALGSGELPNGGSYSSWLTRLDPDTMDEVSYYLIRAVGRTGRSYGGRRALGLTVRTRSLGELCCGAALESAGDVSIAPGAEVSGLDEIPEDSWLGCPVGSAGAPGLRLEAGAELAAAADATIAGEPAVERADIGAQDLLAYGDVGYDEIAERADLRFPGGTILEETRPIIDGEGACARTVPTNWGAPDDPTHACFDHLPVVHVAGDLTLASSDAGQGILLVDGDLHMRDGYRFVGIALVRGRLITDEGIDLLGGVRILDEAGAGTRIGPAVRVRRSSCRVDRAERLSSLNRPFPLAHRGWVELLN